MCLISTIFQLGYVHRIHANTAEYPPPAIEHFSFEDGDRVDIINLSFGFPPFHEWLLPIQRALPKARDNGMLLFAAAGNEGGNRGVFWPAKLPDIICIYAANGYGNMAA